MYYANSVSKIQLIFPDYEEACINLAEKKKKNLQSGLLMI